MSNAKDPTKPITNDEKFKPQNVADPQNGGNPERGKPGDTGGNDVPRGSSGQTKKTPSA